MANTVKLKRSAVQGNAPSTTDLALGELGLNTYDGKLFMKKDDGTEAIVEIGAGGTELASDTSPQLGGDLDMNSNFISSGILGVKNEGTQSEIRLYCESSNAHYAAIKAPLHSNFSGDITFTMPATDGSANQVLKTDGSGNLGWVSQSGGGGGGAASSVSNDTGHLYIVNATGNDDSNIYIQAVSGENSIVCLDDSSVRLYYDNALKLETTSTGFSVTGTALGNFKVNDDNFLTAGTGNDFQIYHDGIGTYLDNNTGNVYIKNNVYKVGGWIM